jgi:hypothetical protein
MRFIREDNVLGERAMTRLSRLFVSAVAVSVLASPISAQLLGGPIGGTVGGLVGGVTKTVSGTVGGVTSGGRDVGAVSGLGGSLQSTFSRLGGTTGGVLSGAGTLGTAPGALSGTVSSWGGPGAFTPASLDRLAVPPEVSSAPPQAIADYRLARLNALVQANRTVLDLDPLGQPIRKRELIATNPDAASLVQVWKAGFRVLADEQDRTLGIRLVTLGIPKKMNVRQALTVAHRAAPALAVDYNYIYEPSGGALLPAAGARLAAAAPVGGRMRIAMIDGGVAAHPALARASIEQRGFAGDAQPTGHGTAVGSLLVGEQGPFHGAARGAQLYVGDVYGGDPAAGSATSVLHALAWAASKNPQVINISLIGPNSPALARAIAAVRARGIQVVAAVGNDGPAAPPQYPASYPGVISVTAVDARARALPEAGRATHLDFAAPGADMIAAFPGQGYEVVRGTSFAAPLAAARLAISGSYQRLALEARPGRGKVGRGIVCADCRVDPKVTRRK